MLDYIFKNNFDMNYMVVTILSSLILGTIIALTYQKTTKCTTNFIITLLLLPILVSTIIIMVNGNVGTGIAIAGAFSLVRFRSLPGNAKEIMSVFFAMTIGVTIGAGFIIYGFIVTIIISVIMLIYHKIITRNSEVYKILDITIPENLDYDTIFNETLDKYTTSYELVKVKTANLGSLFELKYYITLKRNFKEKELIDNLRTLNGNLKICIHNMNNNDRL